AWSPSSCAGARRARLRPPQRRRSRSPATAATGGTAAAGTTPKTRCRRACSVRRTAPIGTTAAAGGSCPAGSLGRSQQPPAVGGQSRLQLVRAQDFEGDVEAGQEACDPVQFLGSDPQQQAFGPLLEHAQGGCDPAPRL